MDRIVLQAGTATSQRAPSVPGSASQRGARATAQPTPPQATSQRGTRAPSVSESASQRGTRATASSQRGARATASQRGMRVPESYASPQIVATYLNNMRRRAALLARTGERGTVYLAVHPNITKHAHWPRTVAAITRDLMPVEVQSFATRWSGKDPGARYAAEWDDYADGLTGLVVIVGKAGFVGSGIMREIKSAQVRGLPILVWAPTRLVPLIDCSIRPTGDPCRWRAMRIELPAPARSSNTLTATLTAMGAKEGVR